jgi:hypothetical protein
VTPPWSLSSADYAICTPEREIDGIEALLRVSDDLGFGPMELADATSAETQTLGLHPR